jgi:hypothetical protein
MMRRRLLESASSLITAAALIALSFGCSKKQEDPRVTEEIKRREAYAFALLKDGGSEGGSVPASKVGSNGDVEFVDGFSKVEFDPPDDWRSHAFRWMNQKGHVRLRTKEVNESMRLTVGGWFNKKVMDTKPDLKLYLDGQPIFPRVPERLDDNPFTIEVDVDPTLFSGRDWVNLDLVVSTVGWHWLEYPDLHVMVILEVSWEPLSKKH